MKSEQSLKPLLWLVAVGFFMQTLDTTIVNTALPAMAASLGESPLRMQSVVVAYSLTMAMLIPASGWVADRFGTRRVYLAALLLFVIGSVLCASSHHLLQLAAARVIQGMGGAMLLPVGRLAVMRTFPRDKFLQAMSFVAIPGLVGPLIGPPLGGWLVEIASWHWVFLINVPVGLIGCAAAFAFMPDSRGASVSRFDWMGYALLSLGMVSISISLDGLAELGMQRATVLVLLILGLACVAAYGLHATRRLDPLFSLQLFRVHTFSVGLLGNLFARMGTGSMPYLIPLLLQVSLGFSPAEAGMMMLPVAAAGMVSKRVVTPLIRRYGYRRVLVANTVLVGTTMATFALTGANEPLWLRLVHLALFGALNSLQFTAMNTLALKDLNTAEASSGNGLFSMVQMLSMSLAVTVAAALLAAFTELLDRADPAHALPAFHATFICVGLITCASAWIFAQLASEVASEEKKAPVVEV
jgi:EmrB/QacA subfamily drug resistance transporter